MSLKILVLQPHETVHQAPSREDVQQADIIIGSHGQTLKDRTLGGAYVSIRNLALRVADYQFVRLGRKVEPLPLPTVEPPKERFRGVNYLVQAQSVEEAWWQSGLWKNRLRRPFDIAGWDRPRPSPIFKSEDIERVQQVLREDVEYVNRIFGTGGHSLPGWDLR